MDRQSKNDTPILAASGDHLAPFRCLACGRHLTEECSNPQARGRFLERKTLCRIWQWYDNDMTWWHPTGKLCFFEGYGGSIGPGKSQDASGIHGQAKSRSKVTTKTSVSSHLARMINPRITKAFWISQWAESTVTPLCLSKNERTDVNGQPPDDSWPAIHGCCDQISNTWNILNGMSPQTLCQHVEVLSMELSLAQIFSVTWLIEIIIQCQVHREKSHEMKPGRSSFETSND